MTTSKKLLRKIFVLTVINKSNVRTKNILYFKNNLYKIFLVCAIFFKFKVCARFENLKVTSHSCLNNQIYADSCITLPVLLILGRLDATNRQILFNQAK